MSDETPEETYIRLAREVGAWWETCWKALIKGRNPVSAGSALRERPDESKCESTKSDNHQEEKP